MSIFSYPPQLGHYGTEITYEPPVDDFKVEEPQWKYFIIGSIHPVSVYGQRTNEERERDQSLAPRRFKLHYTVKFIFS